MKASPPPTFSPPAPDWAAAFEPMDRQLAGFLERLDSPDTSNPKLALAAALLSRSRASGHICLDLQRVSRLNPTTEVPEWPPSEPWPDGAAWIQGLRRSSVVGQPGELKPLVLDAGGRLYFHRFWDAETQLAREILDRAQAPGPGIDPALLEDGLRRFFPGTDAARADLQARAAATAVQRQLTVISGGPGTGKTRTVAVILSLLLKQAGAERCRIALAAPTGKAAGRLQEAIHTLLPQLPAAESVRARVPSEAFTLHRLLGVNPGSGRPRFHAENRLPFEVVIVDEAGMVDLLLMRSLFAAVSPDARLILLGDPDQLASVEAGAVLADVCAGAGQASGRGSALDGCLVRLEKNHRFGPHAGLLELSQAVRAGEVARAGQVIERSQGREISHRLPPPPGQLAGALEAWVRGAFGPAAQAPDPQAALLALSRARILVALRQGPYGLSQVNETIERILSRAGWIDPRTPWYSGRPVLITRNDYHLSLYNGDVGILHSPGPGQPVRACFPGPNGQVRSFAPVRLPAHETAFAMTVHKCQGSEFDRVLFLLPDQSSPILTRELVYTAITRARQELHLIFQPAVFATAVGRTAARASGLREQLWGGAAPPPA